MRNILATRFHFDFASPGASTPGPSRPISAISRSQDTVRYTELAPNSVQKLIPGLTAPAASFEATVGGSAARGSSNFSRKSR